MYSSCIHHVFIIIYHYIYVLLCIYICNLFYQDHYLKLHAVQGPWCENCRQLFTSQHRHSRTSKDEGDSRGNVPWNVFEVYKVAACITHSYVLYCTLHYITSMYVCIIMDHAFLPGQILPINLTHLAHVHCILVIYNWHIKPGPLQIATYMYNNVWACTNGQHDNIYHAVYICCLNWCNIAMNCYIM